MVRHFSHWLRRIFWRGLGPGRLTGAPRGLRHDVSPRRKVKGKKGMERVDGKAVGAASFYLAEVQTGR